jgi:hypothetical protein
MLRAKHSNESHNLAARMGRWSAGHWKTAVFGWLAFVLVAFGLGVAVGTKDIDPNTAGPGESGRMDKILDAGFKQPAGESVLIQSRSVRVGDPAFTAAIEDVVARVSKVAAVQNLRSPLAPGNAGQIAQAKQAALVEFDIRGDKDEAKDMVGPVLDAVADAQRVHPGFFIGEFGDASGRPRERRPLLNSDHAHHPRRRVRRACGRGHSAAAGAHGRLRDVRTLGPTESRAAARA